MQKFDWNRLSHEERQAIGQLAEANYPWPIEDGLDQLLAMEMLEEATEIDGIIDAVQSGFVDPRVLRKLKLTNG